MKKLTLFLAFAMIVTFAFPSGLLTNTNQSAQFIRMMSRNASLGIDGVYYNPAGLIKLEDGWHFSINSQTIFQTRTIDSQFPWLNDGYYEGAVDVPVFPTGFAVYKNDKWAFSFGFGPNAGGGSAVYDRGIPSFEIPISKFGMGLGSIGALFENFGAPSVSGYDANLKLDGSSIFWGYQLGATYEINEMISVSAGVRYMSAKNVYQGSITDIVVETGTGPIGGSNYLELVSPILDQASGMLQNAATMMSGAISAGLLDPNANVTDPQLLGLLSYLNIETITNQAALDLMNSTQGSLAVLQGTDVSDKEVDVEQNGAGFTPILGVNITPNENLNIGLRYEHKTYMTVENNTTIDDLGLFPDGAISRSDVPGIIGAGIGYTDNDKFELQLSYNMYLDKYVSWGGNVRDISVWKDIDQSQIRIREIENNSFDVGLGAQFNITEAFSISAGSQYQKAGVADSYHSDFSYTSPTTIAVGGGFMWKITEQLTLDAAVSTVFYEDTEVEFFDPVLNGSYDETYGKETLNFAVGLSYSIFR